jgi:uncharacterized Fe-S center protein
MAEKVYFISVENGKESEATAKKIISLIKKADLKSFINKNDLVAVKMHFGEKENDTHIPPVFVRPVIEEINRSEGNPFLTDTCVLYRSQRDNAVNHLRLAHEHGFTVENVGAPVIIADGLLGGGEKEISISGKIFNKVSIANTALEVNSLVALTHVTGHMGTGLGGAIKNLGMGFASRKGKLRQHSVMKPNISESFCTGCGICIEWCPEDVIYMKGDVAWIDSKNCIGCGECITVCRFGAVKHDWSVEDNELQRRMTEHALGVVTGKEKKVFCMNFLISVTKDCDCLDRKQQPIIPDIGILASKDPVAVDAASLNLIREKTGKNLTDLSYPKIDAWVQLRHGEEIGLGKAEYDLVEV